jgi:hypothetical protein
MMATMRTKKAIKPGQNNIYNNSLVFSNAYFISNLLVPIAIGIEV